MDYSILTDEELRKLLFNEEDRLSRAAVDEFIRRGERMTPMIAEIVCDQLNWDEKFPRWWAVIHATYILGAIATEQTIIPLLRALRLADAFDCDWVTQEMPSILGRLGPAAVDPLKAMAADQTNGWFIRAVVMEGLTLIAWRNPALKKEISAFIDSIFSDTKTEPETKKFAGGTLLDFRDEEYKKKLLAFGREERKRKDENFFYPAHFFENDVLEAYSADGKYMGRYERDWLTFYDKEAIEERQKRWEEEDKKDSLNADDNGTITRTNTKIGRNEPCPCGSGKKYKKCCGG